MFILLILALPVFSADWKQIFEYQEIDFESIKYDLKTGIIKFFVKKYKKEPSEKIINQNYDYIITRWALNCPAQKIRIELFSIYDIYGNVIASDENIPEWSVIIPDTYSDGYYRLFCLIPFNENPLLKK